MITSLIDRKADIVALYGKYKRALGTLVIEYAVTDVGGLRVPRDFGRDWKAIKADHLMNIVRLAKESRDFVVEEQLGEEIEPLIEEMHGTEMASLLDAMWVDYLSLIDAQMNKDGQDWDRRYRKFRLDTLYTAGDAHAHQSALDELLSNSQLRYQDTAGRRWKSQDYIASETHRLLFGIHNALSAWLIAKAGQTELVIERPGHALNGRVISLKEFVSNQGAWFHPRANAIVRAL